MSRIACCAAMAMLAVSFGAFAADEDDGAAQAVKPGEGDLQWSVYPSDEPVKAFAIVGNILWYATASKVVSTPLGKAKKTDIQNFQKLGNLPAEAATCMAADASGSVWVGTTEGLAQRRGAEFVNFTTEKGLPDNGINAVATPKGGKVWIGTNAGAAVYDGRAWTVYSTTNGLPGNKVSAIVADDAGRVWVGTDKGIGCQENGMWTAHTMKKGMSWNNVRALGYDDRKKMVWAAVGENDVNAWDGKKWKVYMSIESGITAILCDTQSRIWFGSETGLIKFNGEEWIMQAEKIGVDRKSVV